MTSLLMWLQARKELWERFLRAFLGQTEVRNTCRQNIHAFRVCARRLFLESNFSDKGISSLRKQPPLIRSRYLPLLRTKREDSESSGSEWETAVFAGYLTADKTIKSLKLALFKRWSIEPALNIGQRDWTLSRKVSKEGLDKFSPLDFCASQHWIIVELIMQNWSVNQPALLSIFRTDLRHQYGISGGESQTSIFAFRTFHMTSQKLKLQNFSSSRYITSRVHKSSWKLISIQFFFSEWVLGFVLDHAWISKLLRDAVFTWRPSWLKSDLFRNLLQGIWPSEQFLH